MFARLKRSGTGPGCPGRVYLVVVENERVLLSPAAPMEHRQRQIARLGRVDHLSTGEQNVLVADLSRILARVHSIRPKPGHVRSG